MATELNVVVVKLTAPLSGSVRLPQSTSEGGKTIPYCLSMNSPSSQLWPVFPSGQTHILSELGTKGLGHSSTHIELL